MRQTKPAQLAFGRTLIYLLTYLLTYTDKIWPKSVKKLCVCEHALTVSLGRPVKSPATAVPDGSPFEDLGRQWPNLSHRKVVQNQKINVNKHTNCNTQIAFSTVEASAAYLKE